MTPAQLPAFLQRFADRAQAAALAAANAAAQAYQAEVVRSMHGPAPSPKGTPPARRSGTLARSVRAKPAVLSGTVRAKSSVAPHTVYARIQQLGGPIDAKRHPVLGNPKVGWFGKHVDLPARPYMTMPAARLARVRKAGKTAARRAIGG
jgi:phage gpG-like protein